MTPPCCKQGLTSPQAPPEQVNWPFISVVVPVRNEERFLRATLEQILAQDYNHKRFEVLVSDGQSTDGTRAIVGQLQAAYPNLRLLDNPGRLSSSGRNVAIRAARGDIVVVIDGHCDLESDQHLRTLAEAFAESGAACVGRPQPLDVAAANALQRAIAAARASRLGHNPSSFIYSDTPRFVPPQSVAVAYRREVFAEVGLFDEGFDACEDVEFNHRVDRAGLPCYFTPRVRVHYYPRDNVSGLFGQLQRYGRGRIRLLRKHPETFSVACLVPALFLAGLVVGPALAAVSGWLAALYASAIALYLVAIGLGSVMLAWRNGDLRMLPWLPLVFMAIHGGAGTGIWRELFAGWLWRRKAVEAAQLAEPPALLPLPREANANNERRQAA
jgi:succinoglycan biosynthesis protein ExoA